MLSRAGSGDRKCGGAIANSALVLLSVGLSCLAAEKVCRLLDASDPRISEEFACRAQDPVLGGGFQRNCTCVLRKMRAGKVIVEGRFSTDAHGHRVVPSRRKGKKRGSILFFGCSFTLGEGLNDDETLPYHFSAASPSLVPYNFAGRGFGPQQMYAALAETDVPRQIGSEGPRKALVYVFMDFHVARAAGTYGFIEEWGRNFPRYVVTAEGRLIRRGTVANSLRYRVQRSLAKSALFRRSLGRYLKRISGRDIDLAARLIGDSATRFEQQFRSKDFHVVIYPGSRQNINGRIIPLLRQAGIHCLDYSRLVDMRQSRYHLADGHPTGEVNRIVAERLARDLAIP